jgi:hypothetical protein
MKKTVERQKWIMSPKFITSSKRKKKWGWGGGGMGRGERRRYK